jgi:hypothetical protein
MNTTVQEVDVIEHAVILNTTDFFTDLGHVRIIVDNAL